MKTPETICTRLYLFPLNFTTLPLPAGSLEMVTPCYLVQTSDGQNILIDTGLPSDYQAPPIARVHDGALTVIEHLAKIGLQPRDITTVIATHFDPDHAGFHDSFPDAGFIVQRDHYELARSGHPRYASIRSHWDDARLRYRLIDGDAEIVPGLRLIRTDGHAPGHQSVLVDLPQNGYVLLAIDAVVMARLFTTDRAAWPTDDNQAQLRESTQKLRDLVRGFNVGLVVFGHDGQQWQTLKTSPDFYE